MAVQRKLNPGPIRKRNTLAVNEGAQSETEVWEGDYENLLQKMRAVWREWAKASLVPDGPNGILTLSKEKPAPKDWNHVGGDVIDEVIWRELRQSAVLHPTFVENLSNSEIIAIKAAAEADGDQSGSFATEYGNKLYDLLKKGEGEIPTGVPVVRRTTTKKNGTDALLGAGRAWYLDTPPVQIADPKWKFLKTMDDRRRDGSTYTQIEEWTGAHEWDPLIWGTPTS